MERRRLGAAIDRFDANKDIVRRRLGVFDKNVEVAVIIEDAGIDQLVFQLVLAVSAIFLDEAGLRKLCVGILVEKLHVRMGRGGIEIEVVFLDVFAVVAFVAGEPKQALFEDRIFLIPERKRETDVLMTI
jgi:hypothetical protein